MPAIFKWGNDKWKINTRHTQSIRYHAGNFNMRKYIPKKNCTASNCLYESSAKYVVTGFIEFE